MDSLSEEQQQHLYESGWWLLLPVEVGAVVVTRPFSS